MDNNKTSKKLKEDMVLLEDFFGIDAHDARAIVESIYSSASYPWSASLEGVEQREARIVAALVKLDREALEVATIKRRFVPDTSGSKQADDWTDYNDD